MYRHTLIGDLLWNTSPAQDLARAEEILREAIETSRGNVAHLAVVLDVDKKTAKRYLDRFGLRGYMVEVARGAEETDPFLRAQALLLGEPPDAQRRHALSDRRRMRRNDRRRDRH